ncbi:hypothetical protein DPMN_129239 [Dreissena polymorpha]|uniref:Cation efflux protein transmembrane domain-containing protein n=1 Tax=Dreissena polymorpha TaxID=45954 RepID=A0A9D4H4I8_DREPO|nr:hypothetical protein DPMN_129239 [Dreissena polymorpha]
MQGTYRKTETEMSVRPATNEMDAGAINRAFTDTDLDNKPQQARNRKGAPLASCNPQLYSKQERGTNQKMAVSTASVLQDILSKTDIRPPMERSWETALPETDDTGYCSSSQSSGHRKRSFSFGDRPQKRNERSNRRHEDGGTPFQSLVQFGRAYSSESSDTENDLWRLPLEHFTSKRSGSDLKNAKMSRKMRKYYKVQNGVIDDYEDLRRKSFYKSQDHLINQFEEIRLELDDAMENSEMINQLRKRASTYAKITFFVNLMLLVIKVVAVVMSGSISLISSLVDSTVDLMSGIVIWITTRAVKNTDRYVYPQGRSRLEPIVDCDPVGDHVGGVPSDHQGVVHQDHRPVRRLQRPASHELRHHRYRLHHCRGEADPVPVVSPRAPPHSTGPGARPPE